MSKLTMMQRLHDLAPISRFLVFKAFANSIPSASPVQAAPVAPVRYRFLEILGTRHYSPRRKNNKQNNNGGEKGGEDAWNRAWDTVQFPNETEATENPPWETSDGGDDAWDTAWSTGITEDHFEGGAVGRMVTEGGGGGGRAPPGEEENEFAGLEKAYKENKKFVDSLDRKKKEWANLLRQVREPGLRGAYLKDSEKAEMYKLHKENPEVYTVEKLAKDYRIMRQRVHAILWLKEIEEEEEKKLGHPLDDAVEQLLDTCPEFFDSADREFHVATLPYKPDFKVMPEDWEGTAKDQDEYLWEVSQKEDEILYQEFVQRMNFNKMQMAGKVKCHPHSRRRPVEGWSFVVEELGPNAKRGRGGGRKFVSLPDGSSRPLNEMEKMYVRRETVRPRRKIIVTS